MTKRYPSINRTLLRADIEAVERAKKRKEDTIITFLARNLTSYREVAELEGITTSAAYYRYGKKVKDAKSHF